MRGGSTSPGSRGDGAPGQLLQEEGDPGSALDDEPSLLRVQAVVGQRGDQPGRLLLLERLQLDVDDRRTPTGAVERVAGS